MSSRCDNLQRRLTLEGAHVFADDAETQRHLSSCDDCFAVLEGLAVLDRTLAGLPDLEPPEPLLDELLARIALEPLDDLEETPPRWPERFRRHLAPLGQRTVRWRIAAMLVVGLGTALLVPRLLHEQPRRATSNRYEDSLLAADGKSEPDGVPSGDDRVYSMPEVDPEALEQLRVLGYMGGGAEAPSEGPADGLADGAWVGGRASDETSFRGGSPREEEADELTENESYLERRAELQSRLEELHKEVAPAAPAPTPQPSRSSAPPPSARQTPIPDPTPDEAAEHGRPNAESTPGDLSVERSLDQTGVTGETAHAQQPERKRKLDRYDVAPKPEPLIVSEEIVVQTEAPEIDVVSTYSAATVSADQDRSLDDAEAALLRNARRGSFLDERNAGKDEIDHFDFAPPEAIGSAEELLAERDRTEGLVFRDATGYWRNTYVPGDPVLRQLSSRLLQPAGHTVDPLALLHDAAKRPAQPFDPPDGAALALALSADRRAVTGESRLLLQVGLQATERRGGRRPPLDLALVLDLSGDLSADHVARFRALVLALSAARQPDDRFRLVVAGRPGGVLVEPEAFRFGPLQVALDTLFGVGGSTGAALDLTAALERSLDLLVSEDEPGNPLGSSSIVLAVTESPDDRLPAIERLAHAAAVASVPLSVVAVDDQVSGAQLDRLAIAGQGNRRFLGSTAGASALIDRELASASRAVARAVRLSIRLAPGVRLVDVVGSESLDERAAQRVRDAEQSVDLKIARSLGIAADRGEDEEGIQIVIPAYHAGDAHVILVDVVVPGPGPVADVSVRFKDLVQSRNGVAAAHLELPRGNVQRGPLELNVLHNLLVLRLVDALDAAGEALAANNLDEARRTLETHRTLLVGLGELLPGFVQSREVIADTNLLISYLDALAAGAPTAEVMQRLSDSLRYAARLKVLPAPESTEP